MSHEIDLESVRSALGPIPTGTTEVYLPTRPKPATSSAGTERVASRPDVIAAAEQYFDSPERLHGDSLPEATILTERPIHRMMIYLHAQGASVSDIATRTGYTTTSIRTVLKQPWARARLVQILKETCQDEVKHFLTHEVAPSLNVLRDVRDNPAEKGTARITAANSILDRALGKSTIHIESKSTHTNVPQEVSRIEQEIAEVQKQLAAKGIQN